MEKQPARETSGNCILIVENERVLAEDLVLTLRDFGYDRCDIASTGEAAVAKVVRGNVDFVLMDIQLDGPMDGIDAAEQIRSIADIPLVYITAFSDEPFLSRAKKTMPSGYLLKPFRNKELKAVIEMAFYKAGRQQRPQAGESSPERQAGSISAKRDFLTICSHCKRTKDKDDTWDTIEAFIESHSTLRCSHSICPQCADILYPDYGLYE